MLESLENCYFKLESLSGSKAFAGESIDVKISSWLHYGSISTSDTFKVIFSITKGGGSLSADSASIGFGGEANIKWKLGTASFDQSLIAKIYNTSGKFLTSSSLSVYGFRADKWDCYAEAPDNRITGVIADTVNKLTMMVAYDKAYRQGERYYSWEMIDGMSENPCRSIVIDGNGIIFIYNLQGRIWKSTDHGQSWITVESPYSEEVNNFTMYASNDNYLWCSQLGHPVKYSGDAGNTWTEAGSGLSSYVHGDIFRLKDGSILFRGSECCNLIKTNDYGETWSKIETPGPLIKLYVNEMDDIIISTQEEGNSIYISSDMGLTFQLVKRVPGATYSNMFVKWDNIYYVLIPGYGILKTHNLVNYDIYWLNSEITNLFIDHNGVLIAPDNGSIRVCYRKNSE
jgi:hypothetical protein